VAKLVERLLAMAALRVRIQTCLKNAKWATDWPSQHNPDPGIMTNADTNTDFFMAQKWKNVSFQNNKIQTSMKDFQATEEAFSPPKIKCRTSKHEISLLRYLICLLFGLPASGSRDPIESESNPNPYPQT
jgi:hypothetical protein